MRTIHTRDVGRGGQGATPGRGAGGDPWGGGGGGGAEEGRGATPGTY